MPETRRCPQCQAELPPDAPEGLCPECLLKEAGLSQAASGRADKRERS
jgi:Zn finger protein HypA/HybF involved in hydrogenase expression